MVNFKDIKLSDDEKDILKVIKHNQDTSNELLEKSKKLNSQTVSSDIMNKAEEILNKYETNNEVSSDINSEDTINKATELLNKYGITIPNETSATQPSSNSKEKTWDELVEEANQKYLEDISFEDILTKQEMENALKSLVSIEEIFSTKTTILNKKDLSFLLLATIIQVSKSLVTPYIAKKFNYGKGLSEEERKSRPRHDDSTIKDADKKAKDSFKDSFFNEKSNNKDKYWINILYQSVPYDAIKGSSMNGHNHRYHTLGHDPWLGYLFGTLNILTETITFTNLSSNKVTRKPFRVSEETISLFTIIQDAYNMTTSNYMNLPAALFAQHLHKKSDINTKKGLPVPLLSLISDSFASKLYKDNYDYLCSLRDMKIIGTSFIITKFIDYIISLSYYFSITMNKEEFSKLHEVRMRKILLISNLISSSSSMAFAYITSDPKNLDIGSVANSVIRLFTDISFISKIKQEFIETQLNNELQKELDTINELYNELN